MKIIKKKEQNNFFKILKNLNIDILSIDNTIENDVLYTCLFKASSSNLYLYISVLYGTGDCILRIKKYQKEVLKITTDIESFKSNFKKYIIEKF